MESSPSSAYHSDFRLASLQLVAVEGTSKGKPSGTLSVQVHNVTPALVGRAIDEARNDAEVCQLGNPVSGAGNLATGLKEVITKLDIFIKVVDGVSEVRTIIPVYRPPIDVPPRSIRMLEPLGSY